MTRSVPGYRLERPLGSGSQGEVWLGRAVSGGEPVALKLIPTPTAAGASAARREAALLALLEHPNLIELRDFVPLDEAAVLVLELAAAGSLGSLLRRRERLTPGETIAAISPIAAASAHAHEAGVLHGDISPANILFAASGHPKLADLGVARMLIDRDHTVGTPAYLDPTVAAGGVVSPAGDVFALAAVALHALTGGGPWQRPGADTASAGQVLAVAATGRVVDLPERLRAMPPAIAAALGRALDPDPRRRGSAAELALDLRAAGDPAPVVLAGGRIIERGGRHSAARRPEPAEAERSASPGMNEQFWDPSLSGPRFVPADLTRVTPPHERGIAASLRDGLSTGAAGVPDKTRGVSGGRWLRMWDEVHGFRRRLRGLRQPGEPPALPNSSASLRAERDGAAITAPSPTSRSETLPATPDRPSGRHAAGVARRRDGTSHRVMRSRAVGSRLSRWPTGAPRTRAGRVAGLSLGLALFAAGVGITEAAGHGSAHAATSESAQARQPAARTRAPGESHAPAQLPAPSGQTPRPDRQPSSAAAIDAHQLGLVLTGLDALRARAYAHRDAALLSQVYAEPALLAADVDQLIRSVPVGCQLLGVTTRYAGVRLLPSAGGNGSGQAAPTTSASAQGSGGHSSTQPPHGHSAIHPLPASVVTVEATATMPSATLRCGGILRARTAPPQPTRLRLMMRFEEGGYRIVSQRRI